MLLGKEREGRAVVTPVRARYGHNSPQRPTAARPTVERGPSQPSPLSAKPPPAPDRALGASAPARLQPRVPRLRRLADPLTLRAPRLAGVEQVPARVVAGEDERRQGARQVGEGGQRRGRRRGRDGPWCLRM